MRDTTQKNWVKGLSSTESVWSQPKNTLPRLSNLLLNTRGALRTCDGDLIISELNGALQPGTGPWTEIALFQPVNVNRYYIGIKKDYTKHLGLPTGPVLVDAGAGGTLLAGTYGYAVTANDGAGGETQGAGTSITIVANHKITFSWAALPNATSFNVYRTPPNGAIPGSERLLARVAATSFTDDGSLTLGTQALPGMDTTQQTPLYVIPAGSYGDANIITLLPADAIVAVDGTPGGSGGGGGFAGGSGASGGSPPTPSGSVAGNISPIPQAVQFANKMFLALGNGVSPQVVTDGSPPTSAVITNTFVSAYPDWATGLAVAVGDLIMPTAGNAGSFVFKAIQSGTTGAAHPTWPQTANQQVQETSQAVIWLNTGATNTAPAPRGAAHAIVYAGSLWIFNTSPTTTADNFDGPSCLKMSDLNNPTSWNPINTAFLGKDDGDYGTGLATFTIAAEGISPTGSLVAFKNFKTYQVVGVFGASDFAIQEAPTDMGCVASRSIQFLPGFGIVRLTHLGFAILDAGIRDRLISEQIRPFLFGGISDIQTLDWNFAYFSKGAQSANPPMYMCATPLALSNLPLGTGSGQVTLTEIVGVATFTPGFYFFRVTQLTLNAAGATIETAVTLEVEQFLDTASQAFVGLGAGSAIPVGVVGYRAYIGIQTNAYSNFLAITPAQMLAGVALTSFAAFSSQGSLNSGLGGLQRVFCYDMVLKAWTIIDLPFAISVLKQVRAPGTIPITISGSFNDGSTRRLQAGDVTFDGAPVQWSMRSAEIFGKSPNERVYCRRLSIRGVTTQATLSITAVANIEGADQQQLQAKVYLQGAASGQSDFLAQLDLGYNAMNTHVTLSGSGPAEIHALDWELVPMPAGVPVVIP